MKATLFEETIQSFRGETIPEAPKLFEEDKGFSNIHTDRSEKYEKRFAETVSFLTDIFHGEKPTTMVKRYGMVGVREALSTSDFPNLFGNVMYRRLLAQYQSTPQDWRMYCDIDNTVTDFRNRNLFTIDGAASALDPVKEQSEYPEAKLTEGLYSYKVGKFGRRLAMSWEATVNDDLRAFQKAPSLMALGGSRSVERFVAGLFAGATGPLAAFFSNANKNIVNTTNGARVNNPALSLDGIQDAFTVLANQVDSDGEPILIQDVVLVVPPALKMTALNLIKGSEIIVGGQGQTGGGGTPAIAIRSANWFQSMAGLAINYYLPIISTTNGTTSWYLFANPKTSGRPALEVGFLRGFETPQMLMKTGNQALMGGAPQQEFGDFDTDTIQYKVRLVYGGVAVDPKMAVASNGTGS